MHHLIQHGKVRSQMINIPEGFPELLSDITREVLRCQPTRECLCQFVIDYLQSIMAARDKARVAKSIIDQALLTVDEIIADMCICDIPKTKADQMCEAMEECFRRFLAQRRCERDKTKEIIKFNDFDMLDELIKKCKFSDEELKISKPVIEEAYQKFVNAYMTARENTGGTESLYQYFREREIKRSEDRIREKAAIKIQSNVRGFLVRKSLFLDKSPKASLSVPPETEDDLLQKDIAARKIQKYFRRHISIVKFRKELDQDIPEISSPVSKVSQATQPEIKQVESHDGEEQSESDRSDSNIETKMYTLEDDIPLDENEGDYDKEYFNEEDLINESESQNDLYTKDYHEENISLEDVNNEIEQESEESYDYKKSAVE